MLNFKKLIKEAHLGNPLNETAGTFGDGVSDETKAKYNEAAMDEYGKPFAELSIEQKQELMRAIVKYTGPEFDTDYTKRRKGELIDKYDGMTDYQRGRMDEDMEEWPKELTSRYSDEYRFELEKVMSDRAKYRVIDIESGELKGTPVFGKPESLMAFADDLIKPQGGTQSSHFGTNEGTCGYSEDGDIDPENTDKLKPAGGKGYDWLKNPSVKDQEYLRQKYESWNKMHPNDQIDIEKALKGIFEIESDSAAYESLQETLRKKLQDRLK